MTRPSRAEAPTLPAAPDRQRFRRRLLVWYDRAGRALPWRETRDPYRILVSEIMLQQTQAERVLPKYHEWLRRFPTFEALAAAPIRHVTRAWSPLGYNVRPRRLHAIAREVVADYGGRLPSDAETLRRGDHFTFSTSAGGLDVLGTPSGSGGYELLRRNAIPLDIDDLAVLVADLPDLIRMKKAAARPKDLVEVEILSALLEEREG